MAVKTITIDMEAYEALAACKRPGESFSKVIKRTLKDDRYTASNLLKHLNDLSISDDTLDAIEDVITSRESELVADPETSYNA